MLSIQMDKGVQGVQAHVEARLLFFLVDDPSRWVNLCPLLSRSTLSKEGTMKRRKRRNRSRGPRDTTRVKRHPASRWDQPIVYPTRLHADNSLVRLLVICQKTRKPENLNLLASGQVSLVAAPDLFRCRKVLAVPRSLSLIPLSAHILAVVRAVLVSCSRLRLNETCLYRSKNRTLLADVVHPLIRPAPHPPTETVDGDH